MINGLNKFIEENLIWNSNWDIMIKAGIPFRYLSNIKIIIKWKVENIRLRGLSRLASLRTRKKFSNCWIGYSTNRKILVKMKLKYGT